MHAPVSSLSLKAAFPDKISILLVSLLGTTLEYFEYALYGFLAPVLSLYFFPDGDPSISLLKTFGVLAVASLSKPIGALIFGYLGDTKGRSITLQYTAGIAIPTCIVGLLPGYQTGGLFVVAALILCRMSQGIFMAGESDGIRIYVFEHFGHKRPCLISACISCSAYAGVALGAIVATQIPSEGEVWRWAFLGSSFLGGGIYFLRRHLSETPPFLQLQSQWKDQVPAAISLKKIIQTHWPSLARTIMICGAVGGINHFYFVFQATYLSSMLNLIPSEFAGYCKVYLMVLYVLTFPVAGWAADRWGYVSIGKWGAITSIGLVLINLLIIKEGLVFFPIMALTTISMAFFVVPAYLFVTQQYNVNIRFRCLSLGHAIGSALFSGTNPVICLFLWQATGLSYAPFVYFFFLVAMGVLAFLWRARDNAYNAWFL